MFSIHHHNFFSATEVWAHVINLPRETKITCLLQTWQKKAAIRHWCSHCCALAGAITLDCLLVLSNVIIFKLFQPPSPSRLLSSCSLLTHRLEHLLIPFYFSVGWGLLLVLYRWSVIGIFPSTERTPNRDWPSEERRILYVPQGNAKRQLSICCCAIGSYFICLRISDIKWHTERIASCDAHLKKSTSGWTNVAGCGGGDKTMNC